MAIIKFDFLDQKSADSSKKQLMIENSFTPFEGTIISQDGTVKNEDGNRISPEEIMKMNWLVDCIEGDIPEKEELKEEAQSIVELKGVTEEEGTRG